jgi:hypothetical protein
MGMPAGDRGDDLISQLPPHPEGPERSGGLEGGLQASRRLPEPSFEAASPHLRMRWRMGWMGAEFASACLQAHR